MVFKEEDLTSKSRSMPEKEVVGWVKKARKQRLGEEEIKNQLGYSGFDEKKSEEFIFKSHRPKRVVFYSILICVILIPLILLGYILFYENEEANLKNPLEGVTFVENSNLSDVKITPEFISYLLNSIGVWKLKTNPLNAEKPIISTLVGNRSFYSVVTSGKIQTFEGENYKSDIVISTSHQLIVNATLSSSPGLVFRQSFSAGETSMQLKASETTLFAKGYLDLYNSLK